MTCNRILIADDDGDLAHVLAARCRCMGLQTFVAYDAATALAMAHEHAPNVVCLDVNMPSGSGLSVAEMLAGDEKLREIPVIMLTGRTDHETVRRCHSMNAYYVLKSSDVWQRVEPLLCELLDIPPLDQGASTQDDESHRQEVSMSASAGPQGLSRLVKIVTQNTMDQRAGAEAKESASDVPERRARPVLLYIEDDAEVSRVMKIRLKNEGIDVIPALNATEGYRLAVAKQPDVILCDYVMPDGDGSYAMRRLQENPVTTNIPVLVVTGREGCDLRRRLCGQGARAYFTKPIDLDELLRELRDIIPIADSRAAEPSVV